MSTESVTRARQLAETAHGDQRYGEHPYITHLDQVAELARPFGEHAEVIAYLHDVVEDTEVSVEDIRVEFGDRVARCVALVTDVASPPGTKDDRATRKRATYAKLAAVVSESDESLALVVKAADRLANVRACLADGNQRLLTTYRTEHAAFRAAAERPGLADALWAELNALLG